MGDGTGGSLAGRVAVVTGAGSGIGRACALRFAGEAARVVLCDVDGESAHALAREIGSDALAVAADVADADQVEALVDEATRTFGRLDVMLNNAASPHGALLAETGDADWRRVHSVTLDGVFYGVRAALRRMVPQGSGSIVNVSSGAGLGGEFMLGAYGAAKAGVISVTRTAAVENARSGVRVNALCPGSIATPPLLAWVDQVPGGRPAFERQIPMGRIGAPEEVAEAALFLAGDASSYVTGSVLVVDGGVQARTPSPRFDV